MTQKDTIRARRRDFGSPKADPNAEAVEFDLHGQTFTCVSEVQGAVLLDLIAAADGEGAEQAGILTGLLTNVLEEESQERFHALTHSKDKDKYVPLETLAEIVAWLIEEYAGDRSEQEPDQS